MNGDERVWMVDGCGGSRLGVGKIECVFGVVVFGSCDKLGGWSTSRGAGGARATFLAVG